MRTAFGRIPKWKFVGLIGLFAALAAVVLSACSSAEPRVETEVVEVIKEVPIEKVVTKEVVKEVPVEKIVTVERVVEKEVVKEVMIQPKATPEPIRMDPSKFGYMMRAVESEIVRGGVVRTAGPVEMAHWDLHQGAPAYTGITNMYNNLTYRNVGMGQRDIVPDLATGWEVSNDGLTYTFTLREGAKWHDGVEFTALDVIGTFERILNPPEGVITGSIRQSFEPVENVRLLDTYKVAFDLVRPTPWFVNVLGAAPHFGYPVMYP